MRAGEARVSPAPAGLARARRRGTLAVGWGDARPPASAGVYSTLQRWDAGPTYRRRQNESALAADGYDPRSSTAKAKPTTLEAANAASLETTAELLTRVRQGDGKARERLVARFLPIFKRWAHGRLPAPGRDLAETDDLVQVALLRALDHVGGFEPRGEGAFLAYLRSILMNQVRDEIRRAAVRPQRDELSDQLPSDAPSPLERVLSQESLGAYEAALAALPERTREAVILRLEFDFAYRDVAEAIGSPSANAARMLISRALVAMTEAMHGSR